MRISLLFFDVKTREYSNPISPTRERKSVALLRYHHYWDFFREKIYFLHSYKMYDKVSSCIISLDRTNKINKSALLSADKINNKDYWLHPFVQSKTLASVFIFMPFLFLFRRVF